MSDLIALAERAEQVALDIVEGEIIYSDKVVNLLIEVAAALRARAASPQTTGDE